MALQTFLGSCYTFYVSSLQSDLQTEITSINLTLSTKMDSP